MGSWDPYTYWETGHNFGKTYVICIIAQVCKISVTLPLCIYGHSARGRPWIEAASGDLWSGAVHTTHYYYNYYYFIIHWQSARNGLLLVTSTLLLVRTVLCVFRLSDWWMTPIRMRHHGNQIGLLPDCDAGLVSSFLFTRILMIYFWTRLIPLRKK